MASVLIKGLAMPKDTVVTINIWADGHVYILGKNPMMLHDAAVELPDHGDLIEREYAIASACSGRIRALPTTEDGEDWIRVEEVRQSLKSVPVVIPAERSEE